MNSPHSTDKRFRHHTPLWNIVVGLVIYFSLAGPLWAPQSPGWCKNNTTLSAITNLSFGAFSTTTVSVVTVSVNGVRTGTGAVVMMGGTVSQAVFNIVGCADYGYSILLPPDTVLSSGTDTMTVTAFQSYPAGSGILDANGKGLLQLGASLNVDALQPLGAYTGTYTMEIVTQ